MQSIKKNTNSYKKKINKFLLSNRHVVRAGPVEALGKFNNLEEVSLEALWCDPVHDFGFYKYNPEQLKFQNNNLDTQINLDPEGAKIGIPVRVLGNDAGEKLSILSGIMARLDRTAPFYGRKSYNDHNTFYYQAASMTSGGSSGSPVINQNGNAIALNAGGSVKAASSFFLPLDRPKRALQLIQNGQPISRGTIQTIFHFETYDELRRLGLNQETEKLIRNYNPTGIGLLKVLIPVKGGPADHLLQPGDILIRINSNFIVNFIQLATILDDSVGQSIEVEIDRAGKSFIYKIVIQDLYSILPSSYVDFGGGVVHNLSYQHAITYRMPVDGIIVSNSGFLLDRAGIVENCCITKIGGEKISNIDQFIKKIQSYPKNSSVPIKYFQLEDHHTELSTILKLDFTWHLFAKSTKITQSNWKYEILEPNNSEMNSTDDHNHLLSLTSSSYEIKNALVNKIHKSLVMVKFSVPYRLGGIDVSNFIGCGIIVDCKRGLIVVDKLTVPSSLGIVEIIFSGSTEIQGTIVFIHPIFNFAIISYDVSLLSDSMPIQQVELNKEVSFEIGDPSLMIGLNDKGSVICSSSVVSQIEPLSTPMTVEFRDNASELIYMVIFYFFLNI